MGINEVWIPSPHYSSRGPYMVAAFHTTEGAMKIRDLGAWFQNPSANCSSHHGADNYERGVFGAYVYESNKAWTQASANPWVLSIELCAYASWSRSTWLNSKAVLVDNAAEWLAYICGKYKIPFTLLSDSQAQSGNVKGVCQHVDFGSMGSGHHDCGSGFPIDVVLDKAKKWGGGSAVTGGGTFMADVAFDGQGRPWRVGIWHDGKVNVMPPGGKWYAVDQGMSGAKGGAGIAISGQRVLATYINGSDEFCTYESNVDAAMSPVPWSWSKQGGDFKS